MNNGLELIIGWLMSKLRLGLEWFLNPNHVPLLVGLEQGWFADVGLKLDLVEPLEHVDTIAPRRPYGPINIFNGYLRWRWRRRVV